jgi:high-affinity iron transporter
VVSAIILSLLTALVLRTVGKELEGTAEQVYASITFLLAAGVLTWMIFWMSRHSKNIKSELENDVNQTADMELKPIPE